jgi:adenosylmethionine-8-amino-7-oxononanoate aminotransferase
MEQRLTSQPSQVAPAAARLFHPFAAMGLPERTLLGAEGCYGIDANGRYFDGVSGLYNVNIGYGRRDVAECMAEACQRLSFGHVYADVAGSAATNEAAARLAQLLTAMVPGGEAVLYTTSGAEANDTALKATLAYWATRGQPSRTRFISRLSSFHGCGGLSSSVTGNPAQHAYFNQPSSTLFLSRPERDMSVGDLVNELEKAIEAAGPESIAAFIAEPIIGAGGVYDPPQGYFQAMQEVLRAHGILVIADEVITGFGRIGDWLAGPALGLKPDIVTVSKGITAGYWPLSATIFTKPVADVLAGIEGVFPHGYTMSGHPIGCEVACLVADIMVGERIIENVWARSPLLMAGLQELALNHPFITRVRGDGFLLALELKDRESNQFFEGNMGSKLVRRALYEHRLMLRGNPQSLIVAPPLIMTDEQTDWLLRTVKGVIDVRNFHG